MYYNINAIYFIIAYQFCKEDNYRYQILFSKANETELTI